MFKKTDYHIPLIICILECRLCHFLSGIFAKKNYRFAVPESLDY